MNRRSGSNAKPAKPSAEKKAKPKSRLQTVELSPSDAKPPQQNASDGKEKRNRNGKRTANRTPNRSRNGKRRAGAIVIPIETDDQPSEFTVVDRIRKNSSSLSSVLVSVILHTVGLVLLALLFVQVEPKNNLAILAEFTPEAIKEKEEDDRREIKIELPEPEENPLDMEIEETSVEDESMAMDLNETLSPIPMPEPEPSPLPVEGELTDVPAMTRPTGGGMEGRDADSRAKLAATMGGSEASESAVENGLKWILAHQNEDGSWHLNHQSVCGGKCKNPGSLESPNAATGLALMALLGAGYTHDRGPYQKEVGAGIEFLISRQRHTAFGGSLDEGSMYAHGIATIALAEAYAMTGDSKLHEPVSAAVKFIQSAQHAKGGWRYTPGQPGDMTITGWQIMALKSAQMRDIKAPKEVWDRAGEFVNSLSSSGQGVFGYQAPDENPTMTAIGLLNQAYMGWTRENDGWVDGLELLANTGPSENNLYYNYYATLVMHHTQSPDWPAWNKKLRDYLVQTQATRGHEAGSWYFREEHGSQGGRLYSTAMAIMILEVYYRYMPLYSSKASE